MENKAKYFLLASIVTLAVVWLPGCATDTPDTPIYTSEQVISVIQVYGVPYANSYLTQNEQSYLYKNLNPVGQWAAVYEGNGIWRVQGAVVASYLKEDLYGSTTWTYNEEANKISLIEINCEEPAPPTSTTTTPGLTPRTIK